jgi:uncharacterized protein (DUF2235 family)
MSRAIESSLLVFSGGAYTARAVAALIHAFGLIRQENENIIVYAIRCSIANKTLQKRAEGLELSRKDCLAVKAVESLRGNFTFATPEVWFVGVWDTVLSVGWSENVLFPYTANNPAIQIGRHAVSIDERRAFFRSNLWRPTATGGPKDLKQVWFPGVHCDVGGGYPETESGLSKVALEWMLREAASAGLLTDPAKVNIVLGRSDGGYVPPDPKAAMHESLIPVWWGAEFLPRIHYNWDNRKYERRMNLFRRRTIPDGSLIHDAAYQRGADYEKLLPTHAIRVS